jgi:7-carboxy-7-deazaguanine synthase
VNAVRQSGRTARRDDLPAAERLRITEIFHSIQGEADSVGWPTVFVRLTGCPLRCGYCDTAYAFHGGDWWGIDEVLTEVAKHGAKHVTVTGGEPLAQKNCLALLTRLCDAGHAVSIETSGALSIAPLDPRVIRVMDLKTPGSREMDRNLMENIPALRSRDQVKFVICDRADYEWARAVTGEHKLADRCQVLFSPSHEQVHPKDLAEWILADRLPVRLQVQLHKYLWGNVPGH